MYTTKFNHHEEICNNVFFQNQQENLTHYNINLINSLKNFLYTLYLLLNIITLLENKTTSCKQMSTKKKKSNILQRKILKKI